MLAKLAAERDQLQESLMTLRSENEALRRDRKEILDGSHAVHSSVGPASKSNSSSNISSKSRPVQKSASDDQRAGAAAEVLLRERLKRGEEKVASLSASLTEAQSQSEMLAQQVAERNDAVSVLEAECQRLRTALNGALEKLSRESMATSEASAQAAELSSKHLLMANERENLRAIVEELRHELSSLKEEKSSAVLRLEDLQLQYSVIHKELVESRGSTSNSIHERAEASKENMRLKLAIDNLETEVLCWRPCVYCYNIQFRLHFTKGRLTR